MERILCSHCLSKDLNINAIFKIENDEYICTNCKETIPVSILNSIIKDKASKRIKELFINSDKYINKILINESDITINIEELNKNKILAEEKIKHLFELNVSDKLPDDKYNLEIAPHVKTINDYNHAMESLNNTDLKNRLEKEIKLFLSSYIEPKLFDYIHTAFYDIKTGKTDIIFNFENNLNLKSFKLTSIIKYTGYTSRDFKIDDILLEYVKNNPSLKITDYMNLINEKYHNIYSYLMIKKSMQRLEAKDLVEFDGKNRKIDGYRIKCNDPLYKRDKETLALIEKYPDDSISALARRINVYSSTMSARIKRLKRLGYIAKDKYSSGREYSFISNEEKNNIISYVMNTPEITSRDLSEKFKRDRSMILKILAEANLEYSRRHHKWMKIDV